MENLNYKLQILNEERGEMSLHDYVLYRAQSDPRFFPWLRDLDREYEFDEAMDEIRSYEFQMFLHSLKE